MAKKYKLTFRPGAIEDLDHIYQFISQDSSANAKKFIRDLKKKIHDLEKFPKRGSQVRRVNDSIFQELRYITHKGYLIFYDVTDKEIEILHITGPGQDWLVLFT